MTGPLNRPFDVELDGGPLVSSTSFFWSVFGLFLLESEG